MSFLLYIAHQLKGNIVFLPLAAFSTNLLVYVVKPSALRGIMTIKYSYRKQPRQNSYRHMYQVYIYIYCRDEQLLRAGCSALSEKGRTMAMGFWSSSLDEGDTGFKERVTSNNFV